MNFKQRFFNLIILPSLVLVGLYFWFIWIQQGGCGRVCDIEPLIGFEGYAGVIEDASIRTISHVDESHLYSNMSMVVFSLFLLGTLQSWKVTAVQIFISFLGSVVTLTIYTNAVGFSLVASSIVLISIISYVVKVPLNLKKWKDNAGELLYVHLLLILNLDRARILAFDLLAVLGYSTVENPGIAEYFVDSLHPYYVIESSEGHIIGAALGLMIGLTTVLYQKYVFDYGPY